LSERAFLFDTSVWVALSFELHPGHAPARAAFERSSSDRPACFCRSTQQSFLRLISTSAIFRSYSSGVITNADALEVLARQMANPAVAFREEPPGLSSLWPSLASRTTASPNVWMDAYLAAFAIKADLTLVTLDRDFTTYEKNGLDLIVAEA
jgi:uncharacterized protein